MTVNRSHSSIMLNLNRAAPYILYLNLIIVIGAALLVWSVAQIPTIEPKLNLALLLILTALSAIVTTSVAVSDQAGITYQTGPVISMAAIPFLGPEAAILISTLLNVTLWLIKPTDQTTWKKSWSQLAFNNGMHSIALVGASAVLFLLRSWLDGETIWGQTIPWFGAAILYEEINLWLLIGVLRLQHGPEIKILEVWREDRWASQMGILVLAMGGATLGFAIQNYNSIGIIIFFLPIFLSAYAFRLYVGQMQEHLDQLEQIVQERTEDLEELHKQKDALLAILTHDMITPLTSIQLYAEELKRSPESILANPQLADLMLHSHKTIYGLVRNMLDIEKLQSGETLSAQKEVTDLPQLIAQIIDIMLPEARRKKIDLILNSQEDHLDVNVDRLQMERILHNLLSNAIKYTQWGGKVQVDAYTQKGNFVIRVCDTGYGIPDEEIPYIFERYKRVEILKDKATGTGLGLAITKALVEEHDGQIEVESTVGKGSIFTIVLPVL
ncbi:MAG: HAMP domain-containing sensor histidine kinase [Chloroflexota bacterium]